MTFRCPKGHGSTEPDWCSECGTPIAAQRVTDAPAPARAAGLPGSGPTECPDCMTPRVPGSRYCEVCRHDFDADASPSPRADTPPGPTPVGDGEAVPGVVPTADPPVDAEGEGPDPVPQAGPHAPPEDPGRPAAPSVPGDPTPTAMPHAFRDAWAVVTCDRSMAPDDAAFPTGEPVRSFPLDIDGIQVGRRPGGGHGGPEVPVRDPAASARHLRINRMPGNALQVVDVGSTNGTLLNGAALEPGVAVHLSPGDVLTFGSWTRVAIEDR